MMKFVLEQLAHDQLSVESTGTVIVPRLFWPLPEKCCVPDPPPPLDPPDDDGADAGAAGLTFWVTV